MTDSEHPTQVVSDLRSAFADSDAIEFAILFGSFTGDEETSPSDIDIAIKFTDALAPAERFRQLCKFSGHLQSSDRPFVDVSDIEGLPLDIAHDAVHGKLVYGNEQRFEAFREDTQETFAAQRDTICSRQLDIIERIANQALHG